MGAAATLTASAASLRITAAPTAFPTAMPKHNVADIPKTAEANAVSTSAAKTYIAMTLNHSLKGLPARKDLEAAGFTHGLIAAWIQELLPSVELPIIRVGTPENDSVIKCGQETSTSKD
jgi:hypothetical protein